MPNKREYPASFSREYLCSKVHTSITWTNNDDDKHSIIFTNLETFNSGVINPSENFTRIFNNPGNFSYFDETNPNMKGHVRIVSNEKIANLLLLFAIVSCVEFFQRHSQEETK